MKVNVKQYIETHKIVAIARRIRLEHLGDAVAAMLAGGIRIFEITFDQDSRALDTTGASISLLRQRFGDQIAVGAGTVVTNEQLSVAKESGAQFILAPNTDVELIKAGKKADLVMIPGALTPSEIMLAWNAGADIVKWFPAGTFGIPYLKAIRGPINHIPLMAVGGIDEQNIASFLANGCMSAGIGSNLFRGDLIEASKWDKLTALSAMYREAAK